LAAPIQDFVYRPFFALDKRFHATIFPVSHPARDAEPLGFLLHGLAVIYALYLAVDA
jgi:hypothetical protein